MKTACILVLVAVLVGGAGGAEVATGPATQAVGAGRDTPEGAMNVFEGALEKGDVGAVADSWNLPAGRREMTARVMVVEYRFRRALEKKFGAAEAERVCTECRLLVKPAGRAFVAGDWQRPVNAPDVALPNSQVKDVQAMVMEKGRDGMWRMGRISKGPATQVSPEMRARREELEQRAALQQAETVERYEGVLADLEGGKYATGEEVIRALFPEGTPTEKARKFREQQAAEQAKERAEEEKQLLAQKFDAATVEGAVGCYLQARIKRDAAGVAAFFYAEGDADGRLAKANARRILDEVALEEAVKKQFGEEKGEALAGSLSMVSDEPEWFGGDLKVTGETAEAKGEGERAMKFRKVGGVWKEDISGKSAAGKRAERMEKGNGEAERIIGEVKAGKYKTGEEVREALRGAGVQKAYGEGA